MTSCRTLSLLLVLLLAACEIEYPPKRNGDTSTDTATTPVTRTRGPAGPGQAATPLGAEEEEKELSDAQVEAGRLDDSWKRTVKMDAAPRNATRMDTTLSESWADISAERVNTGPMKLPLGGDVAGPSVLRAQILLDRAAFSPGVIDGRWGKNTEKAIYWMQKREGLKATGQVDSTTFARLHELAGAPGQPVAPHTLSEEDVAGPSKKIPEDIYEKAKMDRLYYETLSEKLGELFHATPELLAHLNPEATLDSLAAGDTLYVPALRSDQEKASGQVARLLISDGGHFLHALDAQDRILYHFPSTLGSTYDPSPEGSYEVESITVDPWWHYQPSILAGVDDSEEEAQIPPGPNNAVGKVWMALTKEHYGIHGTSAPSTIGYATSAGCVRLTNWDALFLARRIDAGTPVVFKDTGGA